MPGRKKCKPLIKTNLANLTDRLETKLDEPSGEWWDQADFLLDRCRKSLHVHLDRLRADSSPGALGLDVGGKSCSMSILPIGTFALRITATNEALECVAFGTIAPIHFETVFWRYVLENPREIKVTVHEEIEEEVCFVFQLMAYKFELRYLQDPKLATDAPPVFLQYCSPRVQILVTQLQKQIHRTDETLRANPSSLMAYYYLRTWALTRGRYPTIISADQIAAKCLTFEKPRFHLSVFSSIVGNAMRTYKVEAPDSRDVNIEYWRDLLKELKKLPVAQKMDCEMIVRIRVGYDAPSISTKSEGAKWVSLVQNRTLNLLRGTSIRKTKSVSPVNLQADLEKVDLSPPDLHFWPQRLIKDSRSKRLSYEAFYLLGLKTIEALFLALSVTEKWVSDIRENDARYARKWCFLECKGFQNDYDEARDILFPCEAEMPIVVLDPPPYYTGPDITSLDEYN